MTTNAIQNTNTKEVVQKRPTTRSKHIAAPLIVSNVKRCENAKRKNSATEASQSDCLSPQANLKRRARGAGLGWRKHGNGDGAAPHQTPRPPARYSHYAVVVYNPVRLAGATLPRTWTEAFASSRLLFVNA